jgi:hypothetical protein
MIPGIELLYQRIADAMTSAIPEKWTAAECHARFYPDCSTYEAEYVRRDGTARSFSPASDGGRAIRELRQAFRQAGHPVWGQVRFVLQADGSFNAQWDYEGCDANGDLALDVQAELRRREERFLRLTGGEPTTAKSVSGAGRRKKRKR